MKIPEALILKRIDAIAIPDTLIALQKLLEKPIYVVGGYLRNILLYGDNKGTDIDIAGEYTYPKLKELFADNAEIKVIPTNPKVGTSVISIGKDKYEYTTFRKDSYAIGGKHSPKRVQWLSSPKEDALRRDFTVNALYYNVKEGKLIDYLNALDDIKNLRLRTVKNPYKVLNEDGLRLLRLIRISATHNLEIEEKTFAAAKKLTHLLSDISKERIREELKLILNSDCLGNDTAIPFAMELFKTLELWQYVIPEMAETIGCGQNPQKHSYDVYNHSVTACKKAPYRLRLPLLLHDVGKPICKKETGNMYRHAEYGEKIVSAALGQKGLRFPKSEVNYVSRLVALHMFNSHLSKAIEDVRLFVCKNKDILDDLILMKIIDNQSRGMDLGDNKSAEQLKEVLAELERNNVPLRISELPINAFDLMPMVQQNRLGFVLNRLLDKCVMDAFAYTKEELLEFAVYY